MVRTGVFMRACIALAADSGSRNRENEACPSSAAQRSASGAPLAGMEIGTDVSTGRIRKTPRLTGRASGVTCTRLLGGRLTITHQIRLYNKEFTIVVSINYKRP